MDEPIHESGGNVFADLGFSAEEVSILQIRAILLSDLREYVQSSGLTPPEAADRLGITPSRFTDLVRGRWEKFSLETLISLETRLGRTVSLQLAA